MTKISSPTWADPSWVVDAVGSRVTCTPAPPNADRDYLVLVQDRPEAEEHLLGQGFVADSKDRYGTSQFVSYRRGDTNALLTDDAVFHHLFKIATMVAMHHNFLNKRDRIKLFQAVLYGNLDG